MTTNLIALESQLKDINNIIKTDKSERVVNKKREIEAMIMYVRSELSRKFYFVDKF